MDIVRPETPTQMAAALRDMAESGVVIRLGGNFSKERMGGPVASGGTTVSTACLTQVLQYEPRDLTVSVEAGMLWSDFTRLLAENRQMVPLDPPLFGKATVGGVVAANCSGPRRRLYGSARDLVIGMKFATLEGRLISSGGMVVKNVAGLDMAKLMIGSFGTLAAVVSVNFKIIPMPSGARTFVLQFDTADEVIAARDRLLNSVLQPAAADIVNPAGADRIGLRGWCLLVWMGGEGVVLDRCARELAGASAIPPGEDADRLWTAVREFVPSWMAEYPAGAVVRHSTTLAGIRTVLQRSTEPALSRAGTGITWVCFEDAAEAGPGKGSVVEWSSAAGTPAALWAQPGPELDVMKNIKRLFDPKGLLNPGRLYGRL